VLQAVNFALNAWGDDVFLAIADGAIKVRDASANLASAGATVFPVSRKGVFGNAACRALIKKPGTVLLETRA
jgi:hypothetical protein